jgi:hypothetical protein
MKKRAKLPVSCAVVVRTANGQLSERAISVALKGLTMWLKDAGLDIDIASENLRRGKIGFRVKVGAGKVPIT